MSIFPASGSTPVPADTLATGLPMPLLVDVSPSQQAPIGSDIVLTFDRVVVAGSGNITLLGEQGRVVFVGAIGSSEYIKISGTTVTINLPQDLSYLTFYTLQLPAGIVKSEEGQEYGYSSERYFTTVSSPVAINVVGTAEADVFRGSEFDDNLAGGAGDDQLFGYGGNDLLDGGDGNDVIQDSSGDNILLGGEGKDELHVASTGVNRLEGGAGDDRLGGGSGTDTLIGGAGNDFLSLWRSQALGGKLSASGDDGNDEIWISMDVPDVVVDLSGGAGADTFNLGSAGNTISPISPPARAGT